MVMKEVKEKQLDREIIVVPLPDIMGEVIGSLTPARLAGILQSVNEGETEDFFTLAEEMEERDPHLRSALQTRKLSLAGLDAQVIPASDDAKAIEIADSVREHIVEQSSFGDLIVDLMDAVYRSYSIVELIWDTSKLPWQPQYIWRDPRFFRYDPKNLRDLKIRNVKENTLKDLPRQKFIVHEPRIKSGAQIKAGLARSVAWYYLFKNITVKDWVTFIETFAMPIRVGKYNPSSSKEERAVLRRALRGLGTDFAAMFPEGMAIDIIEQGGKKGSADIYEAKARYADSMTSKAILGQTMTADNGSSLAQAEVHNEVRLELKKADSRQIAETINRDLIKRYVDYNFGEQPAYPRVVLPVNEPEDTTALVNSAVQLIDRGLQISKSHMLEKLGLKAPEDEDDTFGGLKQQANNIEKNHSLELNSTGGTKHSEVTGAGVAQNGGTKHSEVTGAGVAQIDDIDVLAADWGFGDEWELIEDEMSKGLIKAIDDALQKGLSPKEFKELIAAGKVELNTEKLSQNLTKAMFLARALGDLSDD